MSNTKLVLFFDGCHKIYYAKADDAKTIADMQDFKYDAIGTDDFADFETKLAELYDQSCKLRFVYHADLDREPKPPALQQSDDDLRAFLTDLKKWLAVTK